MREWLDGIRSMGVFLICGQLLIHFRPNGAYVKYLRLLISLIILVKFIEPIGMIAGFLEKGQIERMVQEMENDMGYGEFQEEDVEEDAERILDNLIKDLKQSYIQKEEEAVEN